MPKGDSADKKRTVGKNPRLAGVSRKNKFAKEELLTVKLLAVREEIGKTNPAAGQANADAASEPSADATLKASVQSPSDAPVRGRRKKQEEITTDHLKELLQFDRQVLAETKSKHPLQFVVGTDEVGRGCLAGPVVAAAVILPPIDADSELGIRLSKLNDSKLIPPETRVELATIIRSISKYAIAEASVEEIDEINILQASLLAMRRALNKLKIMAPCMVLVDGNKKIPSLKHRQMPVIQGDSHSASIAAASIIAKVHRDALMCQLSLYHPEYMWHSNKGYGSREHRKAIESLGLSPWHRRSFACGVPQEAISDEEKVLIAAE